MSTDSVRSLEDIMEEIGVVMSSDSVRSLEDVMQELYADFRAVPYTPDSAIEAAIKKNPYNLKNVPHERLTQQLCVMAVMDRPRTLRYVPVAFRPACEAMLKVAK